MENNKEKKIINNNIEHLLIQSLTENKNEYKNDNLPFLLFKQLSEIQEILYLPDDERNVINILRLINLTFIHSMIISIYLKGKTLKNLTERKMFGIYYHSLIRHAPEQFRLFSGRSSNTEKEEATFSTIKKNTNAASNHHPDNVITNAIIRNQARDILNNGQTLSTTKESDLYKLYQLNLVLLTLLFPLIGYKITHMSINLSWNAKLIICLKKIFGGQKLNLVLNSMITIFLKDSKLVLNKNTTLDLLQSATRLIILIIVGSFAYKIKTNLYLHIKLNYTMKLILFTKSLS